MVKIRIQQAALLRRASLVTMFLLIGLGSCYEGADVEVRRKMKSNARDNAGGKNKEQEGSSESNSQKRRFEKSSLMTGDLQTRQIPEKWTPPEALYRTYIAVPQVIGLKYETTPVHGVYLASGPDAKPGPGIVVLHNEEGLSDPFLEMQLDLVARGYRVLTVALYDVDPQKGEDGKNDVEILSRWLQNTEDGTILKIMLQGIQLLKTPKIKATEVALLGYGVGGTLANRMSMYTTPPSECESPSTPAVDQNTQTDQQTCSKDNAIQGTDSCSTKEKVPKDRGCNFCAVASYYGTANFLKQQVDQIKTPLKTYLISTQEGQGPKKIAELKDRFTNHDLVRIFEVQGQNVGFMESYKPGYTETGARIIIKDTTKFFSEHCGAPVLPDNRGP